MHAFESFYHHKIIKLRRILMNLMVVVCFEQQRAIIFETPTTDVRDGGACVMVKFQEFGAFE